MEKLIKDALLDIDIKIEDAEIDQLKSKGDSESGVTSVTLSMKGLEGNKQISLNTNALESKINAVCVIWDLAKNLGKSFFTYVEPTWEAIKSIFSYKYSKAVRENVWEITEFLVLACPDEASMTALYWTMLPYFIERIEEYAKKNDYVESVSILNAYLHAT